MALVHTTRVFAVTECKIYPVTLDTSSSATTYAAGIKVPGVQNVMVSATIDTKQLFGDNQFLDSDSVLKTIEIELDYAKLNLDVVSALFGGTVTDASTTPTQTSKWSLQQPPVFGYVKIQARTIYNDLPIGHSPDVLLTAGKAKATTLPDLGFVNEDYAQPKIKLMCVPPLGTGADWFSLTFEETGAALS